MRCAADPRAVARALPAVEEARVRDLLALAGGDLAVALASLSSAIAALVAERVATEAVPVVLGGVGVHLAGATLLRVQRARGRA
jgi:hypothetical protein